MSVPAEGALDTARWGSGGLYPGRGERVADVKRIAVLRANAVGDLVVCLPALTALRCAYPAAYISLLGRSWHAEFLRDRPSPVDEVIVLPPAIHLGSPRESSTHDHDEAETCIASLQSRRFDIALQLHGGGRHSNAFMQRLGARVTAGLQAPDAPPLDRNLPYRLLHAEVLRLLEAVSLVGAQGCDVEPRLAVTPADRHEADQTLGHADERPLVVLQPGCTDPRRAWPAEAFARVGDVCARRGARVVLNGTQSEAPRLAAVRAAMQEPCLDLAGALSLGGLLGLLERARLVVANDTGPAHLARAIDVPSITLYWICNLAPYAPMSTLRHAVAVSWQLDCPRCGRFNVGTRCEHDDSFMAQVSPEEVLALVDSLWPAGV
jgi:ADP-heptose:LPS heptosyltransferase